MGMAGLEHFYWGTTKKVIVAIGSIFDSITIKDDDGKERTVPLYYAAANKHMTRREQSEGIDGVGYDMNYPAISFQLTGLNYSGKRHTNALARIDNRREKDSIRSYNRVPYDLNFSVWVVAKRFEDSLQIIEQILPVFTPELTLTIHDREEFLIDSNITINLDDVSVDVDYEGVFAERRTIEWSLNLTAHAYYYAPINVVSRIKEATVDLSVYDRKFEKYMARVVPRYAERKDPHEIVETLTEAEF